MKNIKIIKKKNNNLNSSYEELTRLSKLNYEIFSKPFYHELNHKITFNQVAKEDLPRINGGLRQKYGDKLILNYGAIGSQEIILKNAINGKEIKLIEYEPTLIIPQIYLPQEDFLNIIFKNYTAEEIVKISTAIEFEIKDLGYSKISSGDDVKEFMELYMK